MGSSKNLRRSESLLTSRINNNFNNNIIAKGRWVSTYNLRQGLIKRHVLPRYGKPVDSEKAIRLLEPLLQEISGKQELNKLILLVAPTQKAYFQQKLHCFDSETMKHLGSTCITTKELQLMQQFEMLFKYEIVYTEEKLSIRSLSLNSSIISQILQRNKDALIHDEEHQPEPTIKSLRQPKIPVRMRASDVNRNKNMTDDYTRILWKL
ncbi:hypothetical protein ACLKA6_013832 [Drosophila palustris]